MKIKPVFLTAVILLLLPFLFSLKNEENTGSGKLISTGTTAVRPELCDMLFQSPYSKAVNIVIMGDGYTAADINNGTLRRDVAQFADNFLSVPPFQQYQNFINVYLVKSVSKDRGADDAPGKDTRNTVFNSTYGASGIQRLLVVQDYEAVRKWAGYATNNPHAVIILVNDDRYGGSGGYYSVASHGNYSFSVIMHELGHSLGGLADEYVDEAIADNYSLSGAESAKNVSTTSNLKTIKWSRFVGLEGYSQVGAYEGAYYRSKGVWRPIDTCLMKSLGFSYCPVCREQLAMKISSIAGIPYDFQKHRERDPVMKDTNITVANPVNYRNQKITPFTIEDFGSSDRSDQTSRTENSAEEDDSNTDNESSYSDDNYQESDSRDETIEFTEAYDYYEGSFYHVSAEDWEEYKNDGTVNYYKEYERDDHYIYMKDASRNVILAMAIRHLDCYIWNGKQWEIIFQAELRQ